MKRILLLTALCLLPPLATGCSISSGRQSLAKLVPSSSVAVLTVDWKEVSRDSDLKRIAKGGELERTLAQLNINSDSVTELAIFSSAMNSSGGVGMLVKGSFKNEDVAAGLNSRGWLRGQYRGRELYSNPADGTCLLALSRDVLSVGTRAVVEETAKVAENPKASFGNSDAYRRLVNRADGKRPPVTMIFALPQSAQDMMSTALQVSSAVMDMTGAGPLGGLLNKIGYARALSCDISRKGDSFLVEVAAIMKDEGAASFVSGSINLMKQFAAVAPRDNLSLADREAVQSLRDLSVTREREMIWIKVTVPIGTLRPSS